MHKPNKTQKHDAFENVLHRMSHHIVWIVNKIKVICF